jgi:hypothetical protein
MSTKARDERERQLENLDRERQKALQVRAFLISEREIVLGLLEKSLPRGDHERLDNLRVRLHEKERQLQLVEQELNEISSRQEAAQRRLREVPSEEDPDRAP